MLKSISFTIWFLILLNFPISDIIALEKIVDKIAIPVKSKSREFFFTNKVSTFYYGETNSVNKNSWQGLTYNNQRLLFDYSISINDKALPREKSYAVVYPYKLIRYYKNNINEILFLPDSTNALMMEFNFDSPRLARLTLKLNSSKLVEKDEFNVVLNTNNNKIKIETSSKIKSVNLFFDTLKIEFFDTRKIKIVFSINENRSLLKNFENLLESKCDRIENLLNKTGISCNNTNLEKALYWNIVSLDALITNQGMKGIYAGLPWFNDYWGRDTFISLPGATFLIGNFEDAKEILLSFAMMQDRNPESKFFGRIPNRITLNETIYNTADGTPWFVIQANNFIKTSGDINFAHEIYPYIKFATDAALQKHCDENFFLVHEEAETWMDAVGPNGPWSPRGNRANDVQILWFNQLKAAAEISMLLGDTVSLNQYTYVAQELKRNIIKFFIDTTNFLIYDHLYPDNKANRQVRPNLFFVLNENDLFEDKNLQLKILSNIFTELVFPYGVLSLSYLDENFHPYHIYEPYYVKDAAYHNGIIWLWNFGPVISSLVNNFRKDLAFKLTGALIHHTLNRGCVGGLSELMDSFSKDAVANKDFKISKASEPELSGTFVQAWSMSEFIRNFYEDYFGVRVDKINSSLYLSPSLPEEIEKVNFNIFYGNETIPITYIQNKNQFITKIDASDIKQKLRIKLSYTSYSGIRLKSNFEVYPKDKIELKISFEKNSIIFYRNAEKERVSYEVENIVHLFNKASEIKFAQPKFNLNWKSIKKPEFIILTHDDIKKKPKKIKSLHSATCKMKTKFNYTLPFNSNFKEGMTILNKFEIGEFNNNYFFALQFENLVDPKWHPEYGFQLTYIAIAIQNNIIAEKNTYIGRNSNYVLPDSLAFNKIIFIGGGLDVCDSELKVIAKYSPAPEDIKNPLGDAEKEIISFSLEKDLIGAINSDTRITILVGLQDDHGGAGIGVFRSVEEIASEWKGGNKTQPNEPNIYEIAFINFKEKFD